MLTELSVSIDNYYLIPLRQEWQKADPALDESEHFAKCSIQYKEKTIVVTASSAYDDRFRPEQLFNGENEVYRETRWGCKPEQTDNFILIHFSAPVRANALFMTASNYTVYEAPKKFELWAFNDDENNKKVLLKIKYFNWFSNMKKMFRFNNENHYSNYKIKLISSNSSNGVITLSELNLGEIPF